MTILALVTGLIKGISAFVNLLGQRQLLNAGAAKAISESLTEASMRSERAAQIRKDVADMPANQLLDELRTITRDKGS